MREMRMMREGREKIKRAPPDRLQFKRKPGRRKKLGKIVYSCTINNPSNEYMILFSTTKTDQYAITNYESLILQTST